MTGYAEEDDEEGLLYNEENTSSREAAREMSRLKTTGAFDSFLGVDQFWREKVLLVILALQDFALLWMGPMEWPWHFWRVSHPSLWMILDTRTERDYTLPSCENCTDPAFAGLCYEARTGCVPFLREPPRAGYGLFLFIAAGAVVLWTLLPRFSQAGILSPAFTYNIERMLFPLYMIAYTPVAIVFMYAFCDYDVFVVEQWECRPDGQSLIWAGFSSLYLLGLPLLLVHRVRCQTVFRSPLRHETYLRTRELEYRLKLSTFYRDRRLWLQSSFTRAGRHAHAWMLLHKLAMVWLIILVAWGMDANLASGIMTLSYWVPNLALLIGWQTHRVATSHWTLILCQSMVSANAGTGFGTLLGARLVSEKDLGIGMQYFNAGWCVLLVCFFIVILLLAYDFQPRNSAEKRNFRVMRSMRGTLDTGCRLSKDKRKHLHLGRSLNLLIIEKCRERLAQRASIANRLEQKKSSLRGEDRVEGVVKRAILTFTVTSFDELDFVRDLAIFSALRLKERNITIISVCASKPGAADAATKQKKKEPAKTRRNLPENMENSAWQDSALMISRKSIAAAGEKGASLSFAAGRSSVAVKLQLEATDLPVADIARVVAERCNAPGDLLREALSVVACEVQDVPVLCELSVAIDTIIRRYSSIFMEARTMSEVVPVLISPAVRNIPERDFDDWVSREVTSIAVKHHDPDAQTADVIIHVSAESLAAGTLLEKIAVFSNSSNELVLYFRPEIFDAYVTPLFELQLAEKEHDDEVAMLKTLLRKSISDTKLFTYDKRDEDKGRSWGDWLTLLPPGVNSQFMWPVSESLVAEILRENETNRFLDVLGDANGILMEVSFLHLTPELVRVESLLFHLRRVRRCILQCQKTRVTHHLNAIHPLTPTLEGVYDELVHEYKAHYLISFNVGQRADTIPVVSAFLHHRMNDRARHYALVRPVMLRTMLKLLVLRMFVEVTEGKESLLPSKQKRRLEEEAGLTESESDDFPETVGRNSIFGFGMAGSFRRDPSYLQEGYEPLEIDDVDNTEAFVAEIERMAGEEEAERATVAAEELGKRRELAAGRQLQTARQRDKEQGALRAKIAAQQKIVRDEGQARRNLARDENVSWRAWLELAQDLLKSVNSQKVWVNVHSILFKSEASSRTNNDSEESRERAKLVAEEFEARNAAEEVTKKRLEDRTDEERERDRLAEKVKASIDVELKTLKPRKKRLVKVVNGWKEKYKSANGGYPTKRLLATDPEIKDTHAEYQAVLAEEKALITLREESPGFTLERIQEEATNRKVDTVAVESQSPAEVPAKQTAPDAEAEQAPQEGSKGDASARSGTPASEMSEVAESDASSETGSSTRKGKLGTKRGRKAQLVKQLNAWKAAHKKQHGKEPTKKVLQSDPEIADVYAEYQELMKQGKKTDDTEKPPEGEQPPPPPASSAPDAGPTPPAPAGAPAAAEPAAEPTAPDAPDPPQADAAPEAASAEAAGLAGESAAPEGTQDPPQEAEASGAPPAPAEPADAAAAVSAAPSEPAPEAASAEAAGSAGKPAAPEGTQDPPQEAAPAPAEPTDVAAAASAAPSEPAPASEAPSNKARKAELIGMLNAWKAKYREENGKEPKKAHIKADPSIAPVYAEYLEVEAALKAEQRAKKEQPPASPGDTPPPKQPEPAASADASVPAEQQQAPEPVPPPPEDETDQPTAELRQSTAPETALEASTNNVADAPGAQTGESLPEGQNDPPPSDANIDKTTEEAPPAPEDPAAAEGRNVSDSAPKASDDPAPVEASEETAPASKDPNASDSAPNETPDGATAHPAEPDGPAPGQASEETAPATKDQNVSDSAPNDTPDEAASAPVHHATPEDPAPGGASEETAPASKDRNASDSAKNEPADDTAAAPHATPDDAAPPVASREEATPIAARENPLAAPPSDPTDAAPSVDPSPAALPAEGNTEEPPAKVVPSPEADSPEVRQAGGGSEADARKKRVKKLVKELNAWKAAYKAENGKDPTKSILESDPTISPLYAEYNALRREAGRSKSPNPDTADAAPAARSPPTPADPPAPPPPPDAASPAPAPGDSDLPRDPDDFAAMPLPELKKVVQVLVKQLDAWKTQFAAENGKQPSSSDLRNDETVRPLFERYTAAHRELKAKKKAG